MVARVGQHIKPEGSVRIAIPSEGSMLWGLAWRCSTGIEFYLKYKQSFTPLRRYEHVNQWWEIRAVLKHFFKEVKGVYNGIGPRLSLYHYYECKNPDLARCQQVLNKPPVN